jgi:DNA-binding response OmpR family regulator
MDGNTPQGQPSAARRRSPAARGSITTRIAGATLVLTRQERALLKVLASDSGRALCREALIRRAWGAGLHVTPRTVDVHVARLRKKLQAAFARNCNIETVWGIGYRLRLKRALADLNPASDGPMTP